jgi:hypothetical protein
MNSTYFSYTRVIAVVAFAAGIFLLWPAKLFFLNDDFTHLYLTSKGAWLQHNSLRPVCDLSMWLDYKIWGLNAVGFHITNIVLHLLSTCLVYVLSLKLLTKYHHQQIASSNALLIAAIFFVFCFHAETLYWVIGRSASLGTVFFLLSLIKYLNRSNARSFMLSLIFLTIALFTYESSWIFPVVFVVISAMDVKLHLTTWKNEIRFLAISITLLIGYCIVRVLYIHQLVGEYEGSKFLNLDIASLAWNWLKLILRSFSRQSGLFFLLAVSFLVSITSVISFLLLRQKILVVGIFAIWLFSYLPYLSLGIDTFGSEGERYLYLPSVFLSIIIGMGIINAANSFKYIISLFFFTIQILLLYQFRDQYEVASAVTKATTEQFRQLNANVIYVNQLPQSNRGALIFRTGIEDAQKLFHPGNSGQIQVMSTYKGSYMFFNGVSEQEWIDGLPGTKGKDAVLDFSQSILTVYK